MREFIDFDVRRGEARTLLALVLFGRDEIFDIAGGAGYRAFAQAADAPAGARGEPAANLRAHGFPGRRVAHHAAAPYRVAPRLELGLD